ncbi:regulator of sigma E protease [Trypanosoma cruzi]|nr:regulator of sigma E protease [Trypanosoma cruzi]
MSRNAHWCFETTLHTCDASYGLRRTCLTSTTDAHAPSVRPTSSRKQRIRQGGSKALAGNSRRRHHHKQLQQRCRPWGAVDQLTHGVCGKEKDVVALQGYEWLTLLEGERKQCGNTQRGIRRPQSKQTSNQKKKDGYTQPQHRQRIKNTNNKSRSVGASTQQWGHAATGGTTSAHTLSLLP